MDATPPIPETTVSIFVGVFMLIAALSVVLTLLVVRRRHRFWLSVALGLVSVTVLGIGGLYLIAPPHVRSAEQPGQWHRCPYDRLVWSNMRADVQTVWQPCRRTARVQLALVLLGTSTVTVAAAAAALHRVPTHATDGLLTRGTYRGFDHTGHAGSSPRVWSAQR